MNKEAEFWTWFEENRSKFTDQTHPNFENHLDELQEHLQAYHEDISFEVGGYDDSDEVELIITSFGNSQYFNAVYQLVESAPVIKNWKFTALKPPISPEDRLFKTDYYGVELDTSEIHFIPLENQTKPDLIGLRVLVKQMDQSNYGKYYEGILMVIHTLLGEKVAAESIQYVEVMKNDDSEDQIPITDLPEYIEWKKSHPNEN
jgi:hypothetical protein